MSDNIKLHSTYWRNVDIEILAEIDLDIAKYGISNEKKQTTVEKQTTVAQLISKSPNVMDKECVIKTVIEILNNYRKQLDGSYWTSNFGVHEDDFDEVAEDIRKRVFNEDKQD
jgi:hypothetical protein